ncbi:MAG: 3-oxoacyl-(acyl carrier protein) synthase II, partial [uncultured bacterium]
MGRKDAVIVGYDAISPLGSDLQAQWQNALEGKSGIGPLTRFQLPEGFPVHIAGQVPDIDHEKKKYPFLSARHQAAWSSPVFKYSMLSVARALERSRIELSPDIARRTAVTYSSAIG